MTRARGYYLYFDNRRFAYFRTKKEMQKALSILKWNMSVDLRKIKIVPWSKQAFQAYLENDDLEAAMPYICKQ